MPTLRSLHSLRLASPLMPGSGSGGRQRDGRSDAALLAQTSRDPEAFGVFYVRNFRPLLTFFWSRTRDREVASELAAETFAAALASVERYDPAKGSPQQWLYGIANNQLKSLWRTSRVSAKARQRLAMRTPATADSGWEEIEAAEARLDADRLAAALARVPPKSREAVRLRIVERLDYSEIARTMGCKPGTARSRVFRGLRRLSYEFDAPPTGGGRP